ncbi:uncharacterized protein LOC130048376 [Ostrea edulis]|uniref:uncharacterized protein LOC130048376 n=1 Tax=Ostrea edulis TaxID=37623 RepID=UPI0024AEC417|nr:uncharacterized protein LOC130048376 [Ostrea edulis]
MISDKIGSSAASRKSKDVDANIYWKATNGEVEIPESEDTIDSDILKIAGKISRKIERKERKHRTKDRLNGTANVTHQKQNPNLSPVMPSDRKRKSKQRIESSDMSPSKKTQKEELESVPSPKKKVKHKVSQGDNESVTTSTDNGLSISSTSETFSSRKRKLKDSEDKDRSVSSKKKKRKEEKSNSRDDVTESVKRVVDSGGSDESDSEGAPAGNPAQLHDFRFQRKGFKQVDASFTKKPVLSENLPNDSELWLITAPCDLDMSDLHNQKLSLSGKMTNLDFSDQKCDVAVCRQPSELCPLVINQSTGHLQQGSSFVGQLQIMSSIDIPPVPHIQTSPKKEHTIPDTLRQRFVPFGADDPEPVVMPKSKKKKKHKKDHKEVTDIDHKEIREVDHRKQKKKKKKKRD